jgi:hypothetical protein
MKGSDNPFPSILVTEQIAAPATPATGYGRIYCKSDGLYFVGDDGVEVGPLGVGGGGGSLSVTTETIQISKVLHESTLAADGTVDITGIDQTYNHLKLIIKGRAAGSWVICRFNGDTTDANYHYVRHAASGGEHAVNTGSGARFGILSAADAVTNGMGTSEIDIFDYANTSYLKNIVSQNSWLLTTFGGNNYLDSIGGAWNSTSAINRIALSGVSGNLLAGTHIQLIGIKELAVVTGVSLA